MANTQINYNKIVERIGGQIQELMSIIKSNAESQSHTIYDVELYNLTKSIKGFVVEDEQMYRKRSERNPDYIYVAVKFGGASTNFGSSICQVNLVVFGTQNQIKATQMFFGAYSTIYNLKETLGPAGNVDNSIAQIWTAPSVSSNFNPADTGFRTLFNVSGTLIIGQNTVRVGTLYYYYADNATPEAVQVLAFSSNFQNSNSPQPFPNTEGFAVSEVNFATYAFSISTYLLDNKFVKDLLHIQGFRDQAQSPTYTSTKTIEDDFKIAISFSNGYQNDISSDLYGVFKVVSIGISQKIGDIPSLSVAFSR